MCSGNAGKCCTAGSGWPERFSELRRLLDVVSREGFATEDGEITPGLASVGVAVTDHVGWPAASIAVTFEQGRGDVPRLVERITAVAHELSRRIRGNPHRVAGGTELG